MKRRPLPSEPTPTRSNLRCSNTYGAHFFTNFLHFDIHLYRFFA
uniref:LITAF domain-containing protein n=1 Tax=Parascaris univalens TaxID=6257 RepID=A0A915AZD4_PARUN